MLQYRTILSSLCLTCTLTLSAQKDCTNDSLGNIPLMDLGTGYFMGVQGGLYPGGSNERPASHLTDCIERVSQIQPLNAAGEPDPDGKIVMIGIGASNPMTEFQQFIEFSNDFEPVNDALSIVNVCAGGQGIQKMYDITENYWIGVYNHLEDLGLSNNQVQVVWIEQDNTNAYDTNFPSAPNALVNDFRLLLEVIRQLFPNTEICYVTARAYSGFADPSLPDVSGGLLYPRDYYNGWAVKFLVEKAINHIPGFESEGPTANIPLVTWGSYHWTDGSTAREDGLYLDCELDLGPDGLHLSGQGEYKMGTQLFEFFKTDTTAKYWYYDQDYTVDISQEKTTATFNVYPNPVTGDQLQIQLPEGFSSANMQVLDASGRKVLDATVTGQSTQLDIASLPQGLYYIQLLQDEQLTTSTFIRIQ